MNPFLNYDTLGFSNPFYLEKDKILVSSDLNNLISSSERNIDSCAIVQMLNRSYTFGDRTLIEDIKLTPWMKKLDVDHRSWVNEDALPQHDDLKLNSKVIAKTFFEHLVTEIKQQISGKKNIGILLSGGMDSRIVASVLHHILKSNTDEIKVTAFTWGAINTRDVVYAERIAKLYGWDWEFFELSPENLIENIAICASKGALYSPVHLHAMPKVRNFKSIDIILAGSFGDSVGRAEYSGVRVENLKTLQITPQNRFNLLRRDAFKNSKKNIELDIEAYKLAYPRKKEYQHFELEYQIHYMRKQLNQCMSYINDKVPLYQVFTSPSVFGFIWSLAPECRTDKVYYDALEMYSPELLDIPWARTGCRYLHADDTPDNLKKVYHNYGDWIRNDLHQIIKEKVMSSSIESLNMFNMESLECLLNANYKHTGKMSIADEYLIWIAALSDFINIYNIKGLPVNKTGYFNKQLNKWNTSAQYILFKFKHR